MSERRLSLRDCLKVWRPFVPRPGWIYRWTAALFLFLTLAMIAAS